MRGATFLLLLSVPLLGCGSPDASPSATDAAIDALDGDGASADGAARCLRTGAPGDFVRTLTSGGFERTFHVYVPAGYVGAPLALVFDFHGATNSAALQRMTSRMTQYADERNFIAVHAEGYNTGWNGGKCCGNLPTDDVQFVRDMLDAIESEWCVAASRVYATGFSNGGFLSHRLACEMADRIAAVASVAGVIGVDTCTPSRPISVLQIHGTADASIPYTGDGYLPSVSETVLGWASRDGCAVAPTVTYENGIARCERRSPCNADTAVELCTLTGLGHRWPGAPAGLAGGGLDSADLDATPYLLDFFSRHTLP